MLKNKYNRKFNPKYLKLEDYDYDRGFREEELDDEEKLDEMAQREGDEEEIKEEKRLKILTTNKLLTRLPILLAIIKAGNNSYKLKNKVRQILHLLHLDNKIIKIVYNDLIKSL